MENMHSVVLRAIAFLFILTVTSCAYDLRTQPEREGLSSSSFSLVPIGEAQALKGYVVHVPGAVIAVELDKKAYSPLAPEELATIPDGGIAYDPSTCPVGQRRVAVDVPLGQEEIAVAAAQGQVRAISGATVILVRRTSPGGHPLDIQTMPMHLRVFDKDQVVTSVPITLDAFPCELIIDNLDGKFGNEIAIIWMSVAAGYTIGVTVFGVH